MEAGDDTVGESADKIPPAKQVEKNRQNKEEDQTYP